MTAYSPGWYPDPTNRFQYRWYDGQRWTESAANGQEVRTDYLSGTQSPDSVGVVGEETPPTSEQSVRSKAAKWILVAYGVLVAIALTDGVVSFMRAIFFYAFLAGIAWAVTLWLTSERSDQATKPPKGSAGVPQSSKPGPNIAPPRPAQSTGSPNYTNAPGYRGAEAARYGHDDKSGSDNIAFREFPPSHLPQIRQGNPVLQWPTRFDMVDDESGRTMLVIDLRSPDPAKELHARKLVRKLQEGNQVWLIGNPMVTSVKGEDGIVFWAILELRSPDPGTTAVEIPIALGTIGVGTIAAVKRNPQVMFMLPDGLRLPIRLAQWSPGLDRTADKMILQAEDILRDVQSQEIRGVTP